MSEPVIELIIFSEYSILQRILQITVFQISIPHLLKTLNSNFFMVQKCNNGKWHFKNQSTF